MAAPTNSQRIDELIEATSFLNERVRAIRLDLDAHKNSAEGAARHVHQIEIRMTRMEMDLAYIKEKLGGADPARANGSLVSRRDSGTRERSSISETADGLKSSKS